MLKTRAAFLAWVPCAGNPIMASLVDIAHNLQSAQLIPSRIVAGHTTIFRPPGVVVFSRWSIGKTVTTGPRPRAAN